MATCFWILILGFGFFDFEKEDEKETKKSIDEAYGQYLKGNINESIKIYNNILVKDEFNKDALAGRGIAYVTNEMYSESIADLTKAISLGYRHHLCFYNRGVAFQHKGDYKNSIIDYTECLKIKKDFFWALVNRGAAYYQSEQNDKALVDLYEAKKIDENVHELLCLLGDVHLELKKYRESMEYYTKAIALAKDEAYVLNKLSIVKKETGNDIGSIGDLIKASNKNKDYLATVMERALEYEKLKKTKCSEVLFSFLIEKFPKNPTLYSKRGQAYSDMKKNTQAIHDFSKSLELDSNDLVVLVKRANLYYEVGDFGKCIIDCTKCIEKDKKNKSAYQLRGNCYLKIGKEMLAQLDFESSKEIENSK